jgi:phenylpropionate dioxygenase-like ring-hydroxylating dioxygenase large terminal subunit
MTRVLDLDLGTHNTVLVGHERYFILHTGARAELVHDSCPHRGGPLSLARLTPDARRLSCPWHGTRVGVSAVRRTAVPMVRAGDQATVVLPGVAAQTPITVARKRILANLPPVADCGVASGSLNEAGV